MTIQEKLGLRSPLTSAVAEKEAKLKYNSKALLSNKLASPCLYALFCFIQKIVKFLLCYTFTICMILEKFFV